MMWKKIFVIACYSFLVNFVDTASAAQQGLYSKAIPDDSSTQAITDTFKPLEAIKDLPEGVRIDPESARHMSLNKHSCQYSAQDLASFSNPDATKYFNARLKPLFQNIRDTLAKVSFAPDQITTFGRPDRLFIVLKIKPDLSKLTNKEKNLIKKYLEKNPHISLSRVIIDPEHVKNYANTVWFQKIFNTAKNALDNAKKLKTIRFSKIVLENGQDNPYLTFKAPKGTN